MMLCSPRSDGIMGRTFYATAALLALLPSFAIAQATKTSQIASATKVMSSLGASSAGAFCTAYIGGQPVTVVTFLETGVSTVKAAATSTSSLPTVEPRRSTTVISTSTTTRTTVWTRATMYPDTIDQYTTETATVVEPEYTDEQPGKTVIVPSNTLTLTDYYSPGNQRRHFRRHLIPRQAVYANLTQWQQEQEQRQQAYEQQQHQEALQQAKRAVAVPSSLKTFSASILSSACSTYLGTSTSSFTHSFFTATTTATVSTKWVTETPPPVTSTRMATTTRLALVTTTAQVTATRINVDSETVTQYSGTVTTTNPNYATSQLGPGTNTVYASAVRTIASYVINWDDIPAYWLLWDGYAGVRWEQGVDQAGDGNIPANSGPNYLILNGGWNPVIRSIRYDPAIRIKSLTCATGAYAPDDSYATLVGSVGGMELYAIDLLCFKYSHAFNDFRSRRLPWVDTISFRYSDGYYGGIDDLTLDVVQ